jgi:Transposase
MLDIIFLVCYYILIMYLDKSKITIKGKTYSRCLLRESYREDKKVKHRTIANLSKCKPEEIRAIEIALKHKDEISKLTDALKSVNQRQGLSIGAVWTVYEVACQLGIDKALGETEQGKLGLWQVIARVIDQGSRLSAVRLAGYHAACDIIGLSKFNEDKLYDNLDWLSDNQQMIEDRLFKRIYRDSSPGIFLYDVTSAYLEGTENELSAFGYNRDGKQGKRQIVIGLLCNEEGIPLSIEVFSGNTQDPKTFASQIKKAAGRFGSERVTFVGDRGMIKSGQVEDLNKEGFHYITAITKAQIKTLLSQNIIHMGLFERELAEVETEEGIRYVLRCNPVRAEEIRKSRQDKLKVLQKKIQRYNEYLKEHQRAKTDIAVNKIKAYTEQLKISGWVIITAEDRDIKVTVNKDA